MSNLEALIGFRNERLSRGIPITPELQGEIARLGYLKIHDRVYGRMNWLAKLWHRQFCNEVHND